MSHLPSPSQPQALDLNALDNVVEEDGEEEPAGLIYALKASGLDAITLHCCVQPYRVCV